MCIESSGSVCSCLWSAEGGEDGPGGGGDEVVGDGVGEIVAEEDLVHAEIGEFADAGRARRGRADEAELLHGLVGTYFLASAMASSWSSGWLMSGCTERSGVRRGIRLYKIAPITQQKVLYDLDEQVLGQ